MLPVSSSGDPNRNVYFGTCHSGSNQKWFIDNRQRIHSHQDNMCLDVDTSTKNLRMNGCSNELTQTFSYAKSFVTATSPVLLSADLSKCWIMDPSSSNMVCEGG